MLHFDVRGVLIEAVQGYPQSIDALPLSKSFPISSLTEIKWWSDIRVNMLCETLKIKKYGECRLIEIIETEEFALSSTLIAEPIRADSRLEALLPRIASEPESFPIVAWPNTRMAFINDSRGSIGIFFRIMPNLERVELLWSLVKSG